MSDSSRARNVGLKTTFYGGETLGKPLRAEIRKEIGSHEIAIVDFRRFPKSTRPSEGDPVKITWGYLPKNVSEFYGYVTSSEELDGNGYRITRLYLIGSSRPLNSSRSRAWSETSASSIVRDLFASAGLRSVIHPTREIIKYFNQSNTSDFATIKTLAEHVGFRTWVAGTTGYFVNPNVLMKSSVSADLIYDTKIGYSDTVVDFRDVSGGGANNVATYEINSITPSGLPIKSVSGPRSPFLPHVVLSGSVKSMADADSSIKAHMNNNVWQRLEVSTRNLPPIEVGDLVNLTGKYIPEEKQGSWYVESVKDVLTSSPITVMTSSLVITRNTATKQKFHTATNRHVITAPVRGYLSPKGTWASSRLESVRV